MADELVSIFYLCNLDSPMWPTGYIMATGQGVCDVTVRLRREFVGQ